MMGTDVTPAFKELTVSRKNCNYPKTINYPNRHPQLCHLPQRKDRAMCGGGNLLTRDMTGKPRPGSQVRGVRLQTCVQEGPTEGEPDGHCSPHCQSTQQKNSGHKVDPRGLGKFMRVGQ